MFLVDVFSFLDTFKDRSFLNMLVFLPEYAIWPITSFYLTYHNVWLTCMVGWVAIRGGDRGSRLCSAAKEDKHPCKEKIKPMEADI